MRIALVSREFLPYWGAGIGAYAASSARAWAGAGHEVHVLTGDYPGIKINGPRAFHKVHFHTPDELVSDVDKDGCVFPFHTRSMSVFRTLDRLHTERPFDLIEFPDYFAEGYFAIRAARAIGKFRGVVLAVRLHTPTVRCRELNLETSTSDEIATLEFMEEQAIREADLLLSPTTSLLEWTQSNYELNALQPATVIPYPFDHRTIAELGDPNTPTPDLPPAAEGVQTVLYFGRLERRKGVETLIEAARRLVDTGVPVRFVLVGGDTKTGPEQSSMLGHLKSRVSNLRSDRFIFLPARPRAKLASVIRHASIVCLPSLWENFPNACLEAMSLGACVVGSDQGGMSEMIEDGKSGLLFPGGNATTLGEILKRAVADASLRQACAARAPQRIAELCDPARIVRLTMKEIDKARPAAESRGRVIPPRDRAHRRAPTGLEAPVIRAGGSRATSLVGRLVGKFSRSIGRSNGE